MAASSDPVRADLEWIARDYSAILKAARPEELDLPTSGTAWTNRQLLFHMLLGQRVTRMGRQMEAVTAEILRFYDHASPGDLRRGMTIPPSWDPYFSTWMDRAQLMTWAPMHYQHHRRQLTLTTLPQLSEPPER